MQLWLPTTGRHLERPTSCKKLGSEKQGFASFPGSVRPIPQEIADTDPCPAEPLTVAQNHASEMYHVTAAHRKACEQPMPETTGSRTELLKLPFWVFGPFFRALHNARVKPPHDLSHRHRPDLIDKRAVTTKE